MPDKANTTRKILQYQNADMSEEEQAKLSKPPKDTNDMSQEDKDFLKMLIEKIENKSIELHTPSSLMNGPVYVKLDDSAKAKADLDAFNLLSAIREIYNLWKSGDRETFQIQNAVHRIRMTKERLEEIGGDIFII